MPNIALLARYAPLGASSRVRFLQYLPLLHQAGLQTTCFPLFSDDYLRRRYRGEATAALQIQLLWRRIRQMPAITRAGRFDLLWIEKELLPYLPYRFERLLLGRRIPYALDFDDAIFHNYDLARLAPLRWLLGDKIDRLMAGARLVTCGNTYLAERARRAGAAWVETVPSTIDFEKYRVQPLPEQPAISRQHPLRLVWIGSPATVHYLALVRNALEHLSARHPIELRVIGAPAPDWPNIRSQSIVWDASTEATELASAHVGIMPLHDTPWEQGKCGFKLIQYMAAGLPIVGTGVGMNRDIIRDGINGFSAADTHEWVLHIEHLLHDPGLRSRLGRAGRQAAEQQYSIAALGPRLADLLLHACAH